MPDSKGAYYYGVPWDAVFGIICARKANGRCVKKAALLL